jgi:cytidine deaminase
MGVMLSTKTQEELIGAARKAAENAYAPYSNFRVGAALLCADGSVVTGVNVENRSFGLTNCAERGSIFAALSSGKRAFSAIAVCCIDADYPVPPCGACRQVLSEFAGKDFPVYFAGKDGKITGATLGELYPLDALHELKKNG